MITAISAPELRARQKVAKFQRIIPPAFTLPVHRDHVLEKLHLEYSYITVQKS